MHWIFSAGRKACRIKMSWVGFFLRLLVLLWCFVFVFLPEVQSAVKFSFSQRGENNEREGGRSYSLHFKCVGSSLGRKEIVNLD